MFNFGEEMTSGILGTSSGLLSGLMPLILLFIGVIVGVLVFKLIMGILPIILEHKRIGKMISYFEERGYRVRDIRPEAEFEKRKKELEKIGFKVEKKVE